MDLKLPIVVHDEVGDEVIVSNALLNLASGEITQVRYVDYDADMLGYPWESPDYDFSSGTLSNGGKVVEFGVIVNKGKESYSVSADELAEIKQRAAALFAAAPGALLNPELAHKPNPKGLRALGAAVKKRS
jgi:hypothetical protein